MRAYITQQNKYEKDNLKLYIFLIFHTFDFISVEQIIHEITRKYFNN